MRWRVALAVLAGLLLAAFPGLGFWWTAPLGLATLLRAVDGLGRPSAG